MMKALAPPTEEELHAFVDNELSPPRRAEIAQILSDDAELAGRVAAYAADRDRLRLALRGIAGQTVPAAWSARIEAAMAPKPATVATRRYAIAASVALVLSAAAIARWTWPRGDTILADAQAARNGTLAGRSQILTEPLPPLATRNALLQSTVGLHVRAPDLHRFGFQLAGLALFGPPGAGAAQLQYRDGMQRVLTIYVRPSDGTVRFDLLRQGSMRVCVWQDDVVGAVIMADMSAGEMMRVASRAYSDLSL
jgi:anti-sigma factor RsiW